MDRDKWLGCILDATRDLADERYQERVWVRGAGPEVDSSTVRLMDDYDLAGFIAEAAAQDWISSDQLAALGRLDTALERYAANDQEGNDAARIASSEWQNVRGIAAAALRSFVTTGI